MPKRIQTKPALPPTDADFDEEEQQRASSNLRRRAPSRSTSLSSITPRPAGKIRLEADAKDMEKALRKAFKVILSKLKN